MNKLMLIGILSVLLAAMAFLDWKVTIFFPLAITIIWVELFRKKNKSRDILSLISIAFFVIYCMAPLTLFVAPDKIRHYYETIDTSAVVACAAIVWLSYVLVVIGYYMGSRKSKATPTQTENIVRYVSLPKYMPFLFMILGVTCFYFYAQIYGGVKQLYVSSGFIRTGMGSENGLVFLGVLSNLTTISSWMFASIFMKTRNVRMLFMTIISACLALSMIFTTAGRFNLIFILLPLIFAPFAIKQKKMPKLLLGTLITVAMIWIVYGDYIFNYISYGSAIPSESKGISAYYFTLISEFAHPFSSLLRAYEVMDGQVKFRYFSDFVSALGTILPERLLHLRVPPSVSIYNTYYLKGTAGGDIPPGLVGYFYYAFHIGGVVVGSLFFGFIVRLVETFLKRAKEHNEIFAYFNIAVSTSVVYAVLQGDPRVVLGTFWWAYFSLIFVYFWTKSKPRIPTIESPALIRSSVR